jgi:hypothetical protein
MAYDGDDPTDLVGEQLTEVAFVMDYVELKFNGPVLRVFTKPTVEVDGVGLHFPETGSRDALCSLIGATVAAVSVHDGDHIEIKTSAGGRLMIPINDEARMGLEAAHFVPAAKDGSLRVADMMIW